MLSYEAIDNSGRADVTLWIDKGRASTTLWFKDRTISLLGLLPPHTTAWRPKKPGTYRFCIQASDAQGNTSSLSCAKVKVT
jgi:hypothetical protein